MECVFRPSNKYVFSGKVPKIYYRITWDNGDQSLIYFIREDTPRAHDNKSNLHRSLDIYFIVTINPYCVPCTSLYFNIQN